MVEKDSGALPLDFLWKAFGRRAATTVGAMTALISLLFHTPVSVACGRGATAWFAVLVLTRIWAWLVDKTAPTTEQELKTEFDHGELDS